MLIIEGVNIHSIATCVPKNVIDNLEFGEKIFGKDIKKMIKATGIKERRVCKNENTSSLDLCVKAAEELLKNNEKLRDEIGAVVFVTTSPEYILPNNATLVQHKLGLSKDIPAFDINLACSGYPFGLWNAALVCKNLNKKVLLLDGDRQSHFTSKINKSTAILFSDIGTATIIEPTDLKNKWYFSFYTDGSGHEHLIIPHGGSKNYFSKESLGEYEKNEEKHKYTELYMNGMEIFNFVIKIVPGKIRKLLEEARKDIEDIDFCAFHQANAFMLRLVARDLQIEENKFPIVIEKYGNSCSSSVPLTICEYLEKKENISNNILVAGFGAGLSIGVGYIEVNNMINKGVIEYDF